MKRAVTLLELLIVVLIIGVLATIAIPRIQAYIWKARFTEVYTMIGTIARMEEAYYLEQGRYTGPYLYDECLAGYNIPAGSTQVQKDLGINIPGESYFLYLIQPRTGEPDTTRVFFRQRGKNWAWDYNYDTKIWTRYEIGDGGPARKYFVPPGTR